MSFKRAAIAGTFLLTLTVCSFGQETAGRKPVKSDPPAYPEMARKLNLTGAVKLEVTINPNGTVKGTKVKGGNPVLAAAAQSSVKSWMYEPGSTETTATVTINFKAP
jgi:TonB family protein